jgi:ABC-type multidrug transport system ATPase subunit
LLLDEPTAGVDVKARREFWDLIHELAGQGLTVLVSTHYMDEAERCKRIIYLSSGRVVVQGTPEEVVRGSGVITFEITDGDIDAAARQLRLRPGVDGAAVFGATLRASGTDAAALERAIASVGGELRFRRVEPRLEDVFIQLLARSEPSP